MGRVSLRSTRRRTDPDWRLRSSSLSVRLTPSEHVQLTAVARAVGVSASQLVRLRLLQQPLPPARPAHAPVPDINRLAYRQLGAIGNNLNQLARHFTLRAAHGDPEAAEVLAELHYAIPMVRQLQRLLRGEE